MRYVYTEKAEERARTLGLEEKRLHCRIKFYVL